MSNILITGAAGFLGSNLYNAMTSTYDVTGCDSLVFGNKDNVKSNGLTKFLECDFNDLSFSDLNKFDILVHCATSNIIYSQNNPVDTFQNNSLNTINLFDKFKGKIIYISTSSVYNNASEIPTKETAPTHCVNAYDTSKLIAELYLKQRGNYSTIRLNNTYGVNQRPDSPYSGVIGKFIQCALEERPMTIYGDGTYTRSYTYVSDVVDAIIKAIELPALNTEINAGSPIETSSLDLCKLIWKAVDKPVRYTIEQPRKIDGIVRRALDCTKAKELLGWEAKINLEEGLNRTIQWQKNVRSS